MKNIAGSEEVVLAGNDNEVVIEGTGLALQIQNHIGFLTEIQKTAILLESGLDTKSGITKAATLLRKGLYTVQAEVYGTYREAFEVKTSLINTVGDVQKAAKKTALEAKIAEDQKKLEAM